MIKRNTYLFVLISLFLLSCSSDDDTMSNNSSDNDDEEPVSFQNLEGNLNQLVNFGGSNEDDLLSMTKTIDGNFVAIGFTKSNDGDITDKTSTDADYWIVKFNANLELMWSKTYGGSDDDRGQNIIETTDGKLAAIGYSRSSDGDVSGNEGFHDYWFVELSANGEILNEKNIGFSGNDRGFGISATTDGGYFLSGFLDVSASDGQGNDLVGRSGKNYTDLAKHGVGEFWGIKLDANANVEWRRYFGGSNNDRSYSVIQTEDEGFLMTGHSESDDFDITNPNGSYDFWAVKVDANGELEWQKNLGGSSVEFAYDVVSTNSGYLIAGDTRSSNGDVSNPLGNADAWLVHLDQLGNIDWEKTYGGSDFDSANAVSRLDDDLFAVAGNSQSNDINLTENAGQNDAWIFVIDKNGNTKNSISFGGNQLDFANDVLGTNNAELIGIGSSASQDMNFDNNGDKDAILFKIK